MEMQTAPQTNAHVAEPAETSTDTSLVSALQGRADAAYCTYLRLLSDTPCLGVEQKLLTGKFTTTNLEAHCKANQQLGMHKAFIEAINLMKPIPTGISAYKAADGSTQSSYGSKPESGHAVNAHDGLVRAATRLVGVACGGRLEFATIEEAQQAVLNETTAALAKAN